MTANKTKQGGGSRAGLMGTGFRPCLRQFRFDGDCGYHPESLKQGLHSIEKILGDGGASGQGIKKDSRSVFPGRFGLERRLERAASRRQSCAWKRFKSSLLSRRRWSLKRLAVMAENGIIASQHLCA